VVFLLGRSTEVWSLPWWRAAREKI
jgi:hypothetical protein